MEFPGVTAYTSELFYIANSIILINPKLVSVDDNVTLHLQMLLSIYSSQSGKVVEMMGTYFLISLCKKSARI